MLPRKNLALFCLTALSLSLIVPIQVMPSAALAADAQSTSALTDQTADKDVGPLEKRFFSKEYTNDPVEKRLERLELMVFGGTQEGDNPQRLDRLKKAIASRQAQQAKPQSPTSAAQADESKAPTSSNQYPVLKTLEWRAFKKTFPGETLDQRLSRLETKTFGTANHSMAYVDRVDRLKRTLGIELAPQTAQMPSAPGMAVPSPLGPAPRARAHGQSADDYWSFSTPNFGGGVAPNFGGGMAPNFGGGGMAPNFGGGGGFGQGAGPLSTTLNNMMEEMNRQMQQMQELQQLPSGMYTVDPKTGEWVDRLSGKRFKPNQSGMVPGAPHPQAGRAPTKQFSQMQPPTFKAPKIEPKAFPFPGQQDNNTLPPYSDPNSI